MRRTELLLTVLTLTAALALRADALINKIHGAMGAGGHRMIGQNLPLHSREERSLLGLSAFAQGDGITIQSQYSTGTVSSYNSWDFWFANADGSIQDCDYCKKQLNGFLACAAAQTYPAGLPPAVNWTAPAECVAKWSGVAQCQFGEVGYTIIHDVPASVSYVWGTVIGGCKQPLSYYAIVGGGKRSAVKAITCKKCQDVMTKTLDCVVKAGELNDATWIQCTYNKSPEYSALVGACWAGSDFAVAWNDGLTPPNWVSALAYTGGTEIYTQCSSSQAFRKGGLAGNGRSIIAGSMTSAFPFTQPSP